MLQGTTAWGVVPSASCRPHLETVLLIHRPRIVIFHTPSTMASKRVAEQVEVLRKENETLRQALTRTHEANVELQRQVDTLKRENKELARAHEANTELQHQIETLKREIKELSLIHISEPTRPY